MFRSYSEALREAGVKVEDVPHPKKFETLYQ